MVHRYPVHSIETPTSSPQTPVRLFTEKATAVASGIGGPLAGAYLIARNFRSLGNERAAKITMIVGGIFTVALFTMPAVLPSSVLEKVPEHLVPAAYGLIGYVVVKKLQQEDIEAHLKAGGKKGSWQMIVGTGITALALSLGYSYAAVFLASSSSVPHFDGEAYRMRKTGATIYYDKANIPESDAMFVGIELEEMGYFSTGTRLPAGFRKEGDKYTIELFVDDQHWDSPEVKDDVSLFLRVLRQWHPDAQFQVRFLGTDWIGRRKTKIVSL